MSRAPLPPQRPARAVVAGIAIVQLLAVGLWASGLLTLGAVVAPIVFRVVPAPGSADAMTLVFQRFDRIAITCAAISLVAEAAFAMRAGRTARADLVRGGCLVAAAGLAIAIGAWLSPGIAALHRSGAIRGLGDGGLALERLHHLAERLAKGELLLLLVVFILTVTKATRPYSDGTGSAKGFTVVPFGREMRLSSGAFRPRAPPDAPLGIYRPGTRCHTPHRKPRTRDESPDGLLDGPSGDG